MPIAEDLIGQRFGRLSVTAKLARAETGNSRWQCQCDCGNIVTTTGTKLRCGVSKRCSVCATGLEVGSKVGNLFIKSVVPNPGKKGRMIVCICHCGTEFKARWAHVRDYLINGCKYCKTVDLRGRKFGRLTVVDLAPQTEDRKSTKARWHCLCACGTEHIARTDYLRQGRTKSCGHCLPGGRPCSSVHGPVWVQVANKHRWQAGSRKIESTLTNEEIIAMCKSDCQYCGSAPVQRKVIGSQFVDFNGIDRLDSCIGYVPGNVVPCCKYCNLAKHEQTYQQFREWVQRVYLHMFKQKSRPMTSGGSQSPLFSS